MTSAPVGIYVHIPFCARKCGYCDFNAYSGYKDGTKARYVDALCQEIATAATGEPIVSVFFGGGTPTQLAAADLARILATLRQSFALTPDCEVSLEANPADADTAYLAALRAAGFNRISFGVQVFENHLLRLIDRLHTATDAENAVASARTAGFDNLSLDLIFGLPRQTRADWDHTLDRALALAVPHLSVYGLILEQGTPFWGRWERGKLPLPDSDTEAAMFARVLERARAAGYERYEISNYAHPGYACRHNQLYWHNESYFGFGAGATAYRNGVRRVNIRRPSAYIAAIEAGAPLVAESEQLSAEATLGETILLGLRLTEGVSLEALAQRFGVRVEEYYATALADLTARGLVELIDGNLRLTEPHGLFFANDAMAAFV